MSRSRHPHLRFNAGASRASEGSHEPQGAKTQRAWPLGCASANKGLDSIPEHRATWHAHTTPSRSHSMGTDELRVPVYLACDCIKCHEQHHTKVRKAKMASQLARTREREAVRREIMTGGLDGTM